MAGTHVGMAGTHVGISFRGRLVGGGGVCDDGMQQVQMLVSPIRNQGDASTRLLNV
jgi:hypothetical protein